MLLLRLIVPMALVFARRAVDTMAVVGASSVDLILSLVVFRDGPVLHRRIRSRRREKVSPFFLERTAEEK